MSRRYLFSPISAAFAEQNLGRQRQAGACLAFDPAGATDLAVGPGDTWESLCQRLPAGWAPDFIVLYLPYTTIPACLWSAPVPIVGLAADWNLLWHWYRRCLPRCDLVLTDPAGVEALAKIGISRTQTANLYGCERAFLEYRHANDPRDIDILFVGNLHPAVQRERLPWLGRIARLGGRPRPFALYQDTGGASASLCPSDSSGASPEVSGRTEAGARCLGERWRVVIRTGVFGDAYRDLLSRARIVFNRSIRGECNRRVFEAAAAGALLFQEEGNLEVPAYFRHRQECVYYTDDNLDELLQYYLEHEDERRAIAEAGRAKVQKYSFEKLWDQHLALIEREWDALVKRARQRVQSLKASAGKDPPVVHGESPAVSLASCPNNLDDLLAQLWQALSSSHGSDVALVSDLAAALVNNPKSATLHNALGLVNALAVKGNSLVTGRLAKQAVGYFQRAASCDPNHVVAGLNLLETLVAMSKKEEAVEQARQVLGILHEQCHRGRWWASGGGGVWAVDAGRKPAPPEGTGATTVPPDALVWDSGHFPPGFDHFRVEWERAAWVNAGNPAREIEDKWELLRWRLHLLLADLTGDWHHSYEAVLARPDLPPGRAGLGCALGRDGKAAEAVFHLRQAVAANPFDLPAARALFQALGDAGDGLDQRRLARDYRWLHKAAPEIVPEENWFIKVPPVGDELASILILCCNELDCTRQCLESVFQHTRQPYELIIVDNGSTDGTAEYLEELRKTCAGAQAARLWQLSTVGTPVSRAARSSRPTRVQIVRNDQNRGYPAGCNQALAWARGEYLVFLNNDTVVTEGWLDSLVHWSLYNWPKVGLVGAMTNQTAAPQQVEIDYTDLAGLAACAARRQQQYAGKALQVARLTGFCLLARRDVLEQIGGFDERYGLGFFDDDDLCVRAREAGFDLLAAQDVFIHHFGSRTFQSLGIDTEKQLLGNFEHFQQKWGPERAAGYRLPKPPCSGQWAGSGAGAPARGEDAQRSGAGPVTSFLPTANCPLPTVSLTMIVKNEEANLAECLKSAADLVDEIIVVDTGSSDRTRELARSFGAKVVDFPWVDSFAAARNECLKHATGQYIFWLDADDRLDEANRAKLRALIAGLATSGDQTAHVMTCRCLPDPETTTTTEVRHVRLFPNLPGLRWSHRVHEQIQPALRERGCQVSWSDIVIRHTGYQDTALRRQKLDRDLRLLLMDYRDDPEHPFTLFNLGCIYQELKRPEEALPFLRRSLERSHPGDSIVRKLYFLISQCQRQLNQTQEALQTCQDGQRYYPDDVELLFQEGVVRNQLGDSAGAEDCLLRLLTAQEAPHFESVDAGVRGYKARHNLATIYHRQGRYAEAEAQWRQALAQEPNFLPAWVGLGEVYLAQGRWPELERVIERLERSANVPSTNATASMPCADGTSATLPALSVPLAGGRLTLRQGTAEGTILRARYHMARKDFAATRSILEQAIAQASGEVALWVLLSHALLQEGRDWPAAERALRRILELEPDNAEAHHNLELLLNQLECPAVAGTDQSIKT